MHSIKSFTYQFYSEMKNLQKIGTMFQPIREDLNVKKILCGIFRDFFAFVFLFGYQYFLFNYILAPPGVGFVFKTKFLFFNSWLSFVLTALDASLIQRSREESTFQEKEVK